MMIPQRLRAACGSPRCRRRVFRFANLSALPPCTYPRVARRRRHTARGLPPPVDLLGPTGVAARPGAIRGLLLWPRSWVPRPDPTPGTASVGPSLALISAPTIGGFRPGFAFPVSRPFVCECRTLPTTPPRWTTPGLPGSLTLFPTVPPAHTLVRRGGTPVPSPPECGLDHSPSSADRFIARDCSR